jgi:soluble lytic murein transglycosylase-like protein
MVAVAAVSVLSACGSHVVPEPYRDDVLQASSECPEIGARLLAAQIEQESGWDPRAQSRSGAQGIAQFMPQTWQAWGYDADGDGTADPYNPTDAIRSQGRLMCHLVDLAQQSPIDGDDVGLALAAYNAGWATVERFGGIPPYPETTAYVAEIRERAAAIRLHPDDAG